jgi:hypothetical protein
LSRDTRSAIVLSGHQGGLLQWHIGHERCPARDIPELDINISDVVDGSEQLQFHVRPPLEALVLQLEAHLQPDELPFVDARDYRHAKQANAVLQAEEPLVEAEVV